MLEELRDLTTLPEDMLEMIELSEGSHPERAGGLSAMEAAAWLAGEPHSMEPGSVSPIIRNIMTGWSDNLTASERNRLLRPLLPSLIGTGIGQNSDRVEQARVEHARLHLCLDWCIREHLPILLEANGRTGDARDLRMIPPSSSWTAGGAESARQTLRSAGRNSARGAAEMKRRTDIPAREHGIGINEMSRLVRRTHRRSGSDPIERQARLAQPETGLPRETGINLLAMAFLGSIPDTMADYPDAKRDTILSRAGDRLNRTRQELQASACRLMLSLAKTV